MVSQSSGRQDSPLEGVSNDSGDIDGSPGRLDTDDPPCQSDVKFTRHGAAWINPQSVQLQGVPRQVPTAGNSSSRSVRGASPLGTSAWPLENSARGTSPWKDAVGSVGSVGGPGEQGSGSACISAQEPAVLPGRCPWVSLCPGSKRPAAPPRPEADGACLEPPRLRAPTDEGAVPVSGRSGSFNCFSPEALVLPADIEKENAHFHAADMIISAMETVKWDLLSGQHAETCSLDEAGRSPGNDRGDSEGTFCSHREQESGSSASSDSGYEGCAVLQVSPVAKAPAPCDAERETCRRDFDDFGLAEFSDPAETRGCSRPSSPSVMYEPNFNSAELIAKGLYQVFRKCWVLSDINRQLALSLNAASSIVVNEEHVGEDFESSVDFAEDLKLTPRISGTEDWAPPRFQVIFKVHPPPKRDLVVAAQNFFCAGCGTSVEPKFVKRLRYCEYLGKYFCDCCHSYAESCIPGRILTRWDFRKYYVSNFSKQLLDSIWHQPLFNVLNVSRSLCPKAKKLDAVREIQEQLFHIKKLLKTCRFAESALKAFEQAPRHLSEELHLFSLEDLVKVKKGLLAPSLKDILKASLAHVASCELCQGKGFICEFCQSRAVIFPFQTATCQRCTECRACFHKQCFQASQCPRCARIAARRRLSESLPSAAT